MPCCSRGPPRRRADDTRQERVGEGLRTKDYSEDTRCGQGGGGRTTKRSRGAGCAEGASNGVGAPSERDGRRGGGGGLAAPLRRRTLRWPRAGRPSAPKRSRETAPAPAPAASVKRGPRRAPQPSTGGRRHI